MVARPLIGVTVMACLLTTGSVAVAKSTATLTGTATCREKLALPAGAVLDVKLEDISGSGSPTVITGVRVKHPGPVPIAFTIRYEPRHIIAAHMYAVQAVVVVNGKALFVTDPAVRALTHGYGQDVRIVMRRAAGGQTGPAGGGPGSEQAVAFNRWVPVHVGDRTMIVQAGHQEPWIELDAHTNKVTGSGGCNRFNGTYEMNDDQLRFGPLAATRMACPHMEYETAFLRALEYTRSCRVHGRTLEFMDEKGTTLVRLEERNLR